LNNYTFFKSVLVVAIIQLVSAGLIFLSGIVLARTLGPRGFGAYDFSDTWIEILLFIALMGFDRLLILKVAIYFDRQDWPLLRGIVQFSRKRSLILCWLIVPVVMLLIFLRFDGLALLTNPDLQNHEETKLILFSFAFAFLLMPLRVLLKLNQVNLQALSATALGYFPEYVLRPLLLLLFVLAVAQFQILDAVIAMGLHSGAALFAALVSGYFWKQKLPLEARHASPVVQSGDWLKETWPFMLISVFTLLNVRGGVSVLGLASDLETVALYGASIRLTALSSLAISATSAVLAGRIAVLYEQGNMKELQALTSRSTRIISLVSLPPILVLMFWGNYILGLFGSEYPKAHMALIILLVSQIFNAGTGVLGWLVMMTKEERAMAWVLAIASLIHIPGLLVLGSIFGLEGAAFATSFSNIMIYVILTLYTYRKIGINASPF
jgi:O-antigen/teichoic acid export membrane protein